MRHGEAALKKRAIAWNTASGMINAGQSALILVFISNYLDHSDAGIFTIAYALGNLFSTIGKYGVRNYQVTDIDETFGFKDYLNVRIITTGSAVCVLLCYLTVMFLQKQYSIQKLTVVLTISLWKMVDSIEDVYYGMYQQRGRLDIGAKYYTLRLTLSTVLFCVLVVLGWSLQKVSCLTAIISVLLSAFFIHKTFRYVEKGTREAHAFAIKKILLVCFPLFIGTTLSIFVGNLPKYLIDWYLDEGTQAVFGYIMMPAFVIMVLNQFIYQPFIRDYGETWARGRRKDFFLKVCRQIVVVILLTVLIVIAGDIIGIRLLSGLYNLDLLGYRKELSLILIGGGVYALSSFLMVPLTAMRFQKAVSIGYLISLCPAMLVGRNIVSSHGITGAAYLYLAINVFLAIFFFSCIIFQLNKGREI